MLKLFICGLILAVTHVKCKIDYEYYPEADRWLKVHKVDATWEEAFFRCHYEGAVLASPVNEELLTVMTELIDTNNIPVSYFIGVHAPFSPGRFVSIEGVPLEHMPITHMYKLLHSGDGGCLSTDRKNITVVPCTTRLPFICLKKEDNRQMTECGTLDKEYHFNSTTGSCYKVHRNLLPWFEANMMCITEGGHLAILNDEQEANVVKDLFPVMKLNFTQHEKWDPLYIGIRDWTGKGKGTWLSIQGEPLDQLYSKWHAEQPDASGQVCGALLRDGTLDNAWCHYASFFVCEKKPNSTGLYKVFFDM